MASRMNEFREFVSKHPLVRNEVLNGKKTWQAIYEDWVILGEEDGSWKQYEKKKVLPIIKDRRLVIIR